MKLKSVRISIANLILLCELHIEWFAYPISELPILCLYPFTTLTIQCINMVSMFLLFFDFFFDFLFINDKSIGKIILKNIAHIVYRFPADSFRCHHFHIPEPDIGIKTHGSGFFPEFRNFGRPGIV